MTKCTLFYPYSSPPPLFLYNFKAHIYSLRAQYLNVIVNRDQLPNPMEFYCLFDGQQDNSPPMSVSSP